MKTFKSFDLFFQIILLIILAVTFILNDAEKLSPLIIVLPFAAIQIISIFVHLAAGTQSWKKTAWRKIHLAGILVVLAIIIVALLQDSWRSTGDKDDKYDMPGLGTFLFAMLLAALLTLFYTVITYIEWKKMKKKAA